MMDGWKNAASARDLAFLAASAQPIVIQKFQKFFKSNTANAQIVNVLQHIRL